MNVFFASTFFIFALSTKTYNKWRDEFSVLSLSVNAIEKEFSLAAFQLQAENA